MAITNLKWKAKKIYAEEKVANMDLIPDLNQIQYSKFEKILIQQEEEEIKTNSKTMYNEETEIKISTVCSYRNVIREFEKMLIKQEKLPSSHEIKVWANKYKVPYDFVENYFVEQWNGKMKYELTNARIQTPNEARNFGTSTFELNPDFSFVINDDYIIEIDNAEKDK